MFGFGNKTEKTEVWLESLRQVHLALCENNTRLANLEAKYHMLEELYVSMKQRSNNGRIKKREDEEENQNKNALGGVLVAV